MGPWTPESRWWGRERGECIIRKGGQDEAGEGAETSHAQPMVPGKDFGSSSKSHGLLEATEGFEASEWKGDKRSLLLRDHLNCYVQTRPKRDSVEAGTAVSSRLQRFRQGQWWPGPGPCSCCIAATCQCLSLSAAITRHYKPSGSRQQKWALPQFWRPEVSSAGAGGAVLAPKALGAAFLASSYLLASPAIVGISGLVNTSLQSLLPSAHGILLCAQISLF